VLSGFSDVVNQRWEEPITKTKPFSISKQVVWEAYRRVKANKGAAGVAGQSIKDFEVGLKDNLYKIWNRMTSGSYFPPPVRTVDIPKSDGRSRRLGIPAVSDRVAQMVVKMYLEPKVEPTFHADSYGYISGKSALDAVGIVRKRCWWYDWAIDLDIQGFFDEIDHKLMLHAVRKHTDSKWMLLYIERWLKAPAQLADGSLIEREQGTPQGGVVSPLLANIFLHHVFDEWMRVNHPSVLFARYADDIVVHCRSESQAQVMLRAIELRLARCKLKLHPQKTKIVYCKDAKRPGSYKHESFDFLGYGFRPRSCKGRTYFVGFTPAASKSAIKAMSATIRGWKLQLWSFSSLEDIAKRINPVIRGWLNYYGRYYRSALYPILRQIQNALVRWAMRKYKRLRGHWHKATHWLGRIARREPRLFASWGFGFRPSAGQ
jgi:RNA-directed DNA polymerase